MKKNENQFQGCFLQFEAPVDFDYAEAIRKALLLLEGVRSASLVLQHEELNIGLKEPVKKT